MMTPDEPIKRAPVKETHIFNYVDVCFGEARRRLHQLQELRRQGKDDADLWQSYWSYILDACERSKELQGNEEAFTHNAL